jgi:hypothetical protein
MFYILVNLCFKLIIARSAFILNKFLIYGLHNLWIYVCVHVHMYICAYIHMYICIYASLGMCLAKHVAVGTGADGAPVRKI